MSFVCLTKDLMVSSMLAGAAASCSEEMSVASSVEKLQALLADQRVSLVLIDLTFPQLDVAQTVQWIRQHEESTADDSPASKTGVVAFGPHVHEARLAAAQQAGCDLVMSKGQVHRDIQQVMRRYVSA